MWNQYDLCNFLRKFSRDKIFSPFFLSAVPCPTVTRAALRSTLIFCGRATATPTEMKTEEQAVATSRNVHVEHVNNMLAATLVSLKLICAVFGGVPLGLIMEAAVVGRWPPACTWDAFHLSQEMMGLAILAEPFVYLLTLRGLRADFFALFRRNRLPAGVRPRNRVSVINNWLINNSKHGPEFISHVYNDAWMRYFKWDLSKINRHALFW